MNREPTTSIDATRSRIEARLRDLIAPGPDAGTLTGAIADGALAPGKRLRPLMTVLVAEDLGARGDGALEIGCALELVHAASLILDDLPCMDDAELRRGLPAVHRRHGEDAAVLASVALLSQAYGLIAAAPDVSAEARLACIGVLAAAVGLDGLVGGQFRDLRGGREDRPVGEIVRANAQKTGALFCAAIEMGAVIADAGPDRARLVLAAHEIGQAFQLLDDLLDREASAEVSGKTPGRDEGKSTVVSLLGASTVRRRIERHLQEAQTILAEVFGPASRLSGLLDGLFERGGEVRHPSAPPVEQEAGAR